MHDQPDMRKRYGEYAAWIFAACMNGCMERLGCWGECAGAGLGRRRAGSVRGRWAEVRRRAGLGAAALARAPPRWLGRRRAGSGAAALARAPPVTILPDSHGWDGIRGFGPRP
jgi:hypothetical protein